MTEKLLKSYCVYSGPVDCNLTNHDTMTVQMILKSEKIKQTNQNKTKQNKTKNNIK